MKFSQKDYLKSYRRQVKHVSTILEPSIPFHTLVRHVDSEDIAKKIRTNDLALEINKISMEDDTNNKESEHDHIRLLILKTQIIKVNQPTKNIVLFVIKTIMVFQIVIKNNVMKNIKDLKIRDQEFLNNPLYSTSVVNTVIHKKIEMKIKLIILLEITTVIDIIKITTPITTTDIEIPTDIEATV